MSKANDFIKWLDEQEKTKSLTDYELSKRGGFSHSALSRARTGIPPQWDICMKIATVLNISPMTPEERDEMRAISIMKIERRQKEKSLKSLKQKKAG
jgi:hypothetical protein